MPGRLTNEAQGHHWGSYHRWGASRARRSTRAATVSPGTSRPSAPRSREGQREGRRLGPPLASALRGGHGCGRETGGTLPERRNQFGRSQRSEREGRLQRKGARGGDRRGAIGEPREPEETPPTGGASRGPGPAPVRHEALAGQPELGLGGRLRRAGVLQSRGEARARRMPQRGPSELQVSRGAASVASDLSRTPFAPQVLGPSGAGGPWRSGMRWQQLSAPSGS